jgi:predicted RNase H-like HicB family nuclease
MFGRKPQPRIVAQIEGKVVWQIARDTDSDNWIGFCPVLNLTAVGDTFDELQACMGEAMSLLFTDLLADNELEAFLQARGWRLHQQLPAPDVNVKFDMPWDWERVASARELVPA